MRGHSVLERWFAAGDAGDIDAFDTFLHPQVIIHAPLGLSTSGPEAEKTVWREALTAIPDIRRDLQVVVGSSPIIAARAVVTGTLQVTSQASLPTVGASEWIRDYSRMCVPESLSKLGRSSTSAAS
jgi:hypothetical protein